MANKGTCKSEGCDKEVRGKGYCDGHFRKWKKGLLAKPRRKSCNADGCHKPQGNRGLCTEHHAKEFTKAKPEGEAAAA